jgi:ATP-dependent DNA helicase DinG
MAPGPRAKKALQALDAALGAVPGSQERPGQRAMVEAVATALGRSEHLLVQAGTGTGKSLGYLVPALTSGKRVVVATATKALQAQLVDKDLPRLVAALAPVLGRTPTYALAKGRGNYVCLQQVHGGPGRGGRAGRAVRRTAVEPRHAGGAAARVGRRDRDRRPRRGAVPGHRPGLAAGVGDRPRVPGQPLPDRVDCFSERAREAAKEADVVVANHTLLALDVFTGVQVLPERDAVVLDEAHEFVDSVTDALSHELGNADVRRAVSAATDLRRRGAAAAASRQARDGLEGVLATDRAGLGAGGCRLRPRRAARAGERGRRGGQRDHPRAARRAGRRRGVRPARPAQDRG